MMTITVNIIMRILNVLSFKNTCGLNLYECFRKISFPFQKFPHYASRFSFLSCFSSSEEVFSKFFSTFITISLEFRSSSYRHIQRIKYAETF